MIDFLKLLRTQIFCNKKMAELSQMYIKVYYKKPINLNLCTCKNCT